MEENGNKKECNEKHIDYLFSDMISQKCKNVSMWKSSAFP